MKTPRGMGRWFNSPSRLKALPWRDWVPQEVGLARPPNTLDGSDLAGRAASAYGTALGLVPRLFPTDP